MRIFLSQQSEDAVRYSEEGGQSLLLLAPAKEGPRGHLLDMDAKRLTDTAHLLGVQRVEIENPGRRLQYVDLKGGLLCRALLFAKRDVTREEDSRCA